MYAGLCVCAKRHHESLWIYKYLWGLTRTVPRHKAMPKAMNAINFGVALHTPGHTYIFTSIHYTYDLFSHNSAQYFGIELARSAAPTLINTNISHFMRPFSSHQFVNWRMIFICKSNTKANKLPERREKKRLGMILDSIF